jgi:capsular polysaccharide biosynthesis protein
MEDINVFEFLSYIKKHAIFFVLVMFFVLIICLFYFIVVQRPVYTSEVSLTLTGTSGDSKITTNDITLNTKMIPTYQEIITSRSVLEQVVNNLKLNRSANSLAGSIKIKAVTDSMVLNITVTDSNRVIAKDIANEVADIFSKEIQALYNIKNVTILDKAVVSDNPTNMNYIKSIFISGFAGVFVAFGLLFLVFFLDNTIKSVEQVESKMEMVILGAIPDYNTVGKNSKRGGKK